MELEFSHYVIAIAGGFLAGILNTLAGNGSTITLTILTEILVLPGNLANGTNRVGILAQGIISTYTYNKKGKLKLDRGKRYIIPTIIGAIIGVSTAVSVSDEIFEGVFRILLLVMLVVLLINPKRWFNPTDLEHSPSHWLTIPVFLALGFYGGFIQMGMGIFFLGAMVLVARFSLNDANAIKIFVVAAYTLIVLAIFQWQGLIDWKIGLILAVGQAGGAWLASNFATTYPNADRWAYRLIIAVIIFALFRTFGLWTMAMDFLG